MRRGFLGDVPVDGTSGANEWDGTIPFDDLPRAFNPPGGMIITANQNPFPPDYPYPVNGNFAPDYRARQIRSLLTARKGWKAGDMLAVQKDVYSAFLHFVARQLVAASERKGKGDADTAAAVEILRNWNGQMEKGLAAPYIAALVYTQLQTAMVDRAAPKHMESYLSPMAAPVAERLLRERPKHWFADFDDLLMRALADALVEGRRRQGRNVEKWDYGVHIELNLRQPVGSRIPIVGPYFNIGPVPMSGSSTTVKQTTQRIGPSMRLVADLARWDESLNNITIGQSGQFLSVHYKDQWDEYYTGKSLPMRWSRIDGKTLRVRPLP